MTEVIFDKNGHAEKSGFLTVYNYADNGEFTGENEEFISVGGGLPANCTTVAPLKKKKGYAVIFNGKLWEYTPDHRGAVYYKTANGEKVEITELGSVDLDGLTKLEPFTHSVWDGEKWILDEKKEKQDFIEKKLSLTMKLRNKADDFGKIILNEYPIIEQNSFTIQKAEAIAYKADNKTPTPILLGIAKARGISLDDLVDKVLKKTALFENATGGIAGKRQALMDKIDQAENKEQLATVEQAIDDWTLPHFLQKGVINE